jgi:hypothetical protein
MISSFSIPPHALSGIQIHNESHCFSNLSIESGRSHSKDQVTKHVSGIFMTELAANFAPFSWGKNGARRDLMIPLDFAMEQAIPFTIIVVVRPDRSFCPSTLTVDILTDPDSRLLTCWMSDLLLLLGFPFSIPKA